MTAASVTWRHDGLFCAAGFATIVVETEIVADFVRDELRQVPRRIIHFAAVHAKPPLV